MLHEFLHGLFQTWFGWVEAWGYAGVFVLMAMESSIIPVPSEIVMPPAAFWAAQGRMDFWGVVLAGTLGSYVGSVISYGVSLKLGLPVIQHWGRRFGVTSEKIQMAENWVLQFGVVGIFVARLLPVVRHLISIPAGLLRMPFGRFSAVTLIGAGLWCTILSWFGQRVIGENPEIMTSPEALRAVIRAKLLWFVVAVAVLGLLYFLVILYKRASLRRSRAA